MIGKSSLQNRQPSKLNIQNVDLHRGSSNYFPGVKICPAPRTTDFNIVLYWKVIFYKNVKQSLGIKVIELWSSPIQTIVHKSSPQDQTWPLSKGHLILYRPIEEYIVLTLLDRDYKAQKLEIFHLCHNLVKCYHVLISSSPRFT